ncbi:nuclear transport factor 2 family protein [Lewinella sp. 4G2]|uniref:nuclear transport factor 2 family protein n=1 Tax=Lewinella sp. 4G2 TaxID=1803372 RepID=UPI0007B4C458|nr:nuclear transport factor 2 family protein [Lewinella sp. 4G2]OAV45162.1 hypothetical protein A3850_011965 [Lewinella sp. 4G2]
MQISADTRFEILDVIHAYNMAADKKDVEETLTYYVEEGQITGDLSTGKGHAAMREDLPNIFKSEVTLKRHLVNNVRFFPGEVEGDVKVTYVLLVMEAQAAPLSIATSIVTDHFRLVGDGWKIVVHHVAVDPSARWLVKAGAKAVEIIEEVKDRLS